MIERGRPRRSLPAPIPVGESLKLFCSGCTGRVDPLRAARVAIFHDRFYYFCSPECRVRFVPSAVPPRLSSVASRVPPNMVSEGQPSELPLPLSEAPVAVPPSPAAELAPRAPTRSGWLLGAAALGVLAAVSSVADPTGSSSGIALAAALAACGALGFASLGRHALGPARALIAPAVATLAALSGWLFAPATAAEAARAAGVISAVAASGVLWIARRRRATAAFRFPLSEALGASLETELAGALEPEHIPATSADLKPGEELVLRPGQRIHVDAVITAGHARVQPWPGSGFSLARGEGDGLLAGAALVDGALRAVVRWTGHDRAWARLSVDPARRADRHLAIARLAERASTTGALALGVVAGSVSVALDVHPVLAMANAASVAAAFGSVALAELVALGISLGVSGLAVRGICFRNAAALDRAGRTQSVVFCDRGSLLSGELSVASIEPTSAITESDLLALLGGAYGGVASPLATALARTLTAHKIRADATRSPNHLPGLGVTAVASNGQALVAGTRALLLERRISVASAETRIAELEALGRSVLLIALDGRWVGLVALQDGLRSGARAATQYLLDAGVEPVLLSGEARETCRALARHVGIEHVRPEVLPQDRAAEVRRLSRAGGMLAVVGSSIDDAALAAAPLSINIDPRGGPLERSDIDIVSGDVRDAAVAIALSRALQTATRLLLITATAPTAIGLLAIFVGVPAWVLPLLGLAGLMLAARRLGNARRHGVRDTSRHGELGDADGTRRLSQLPELPYADSRHSSAEPHLAGHEGLARSSRPLGAALESAEAGPSAPQRSEDTIPPNTLRAVAGPVAAAPVSSLPEQPLPEESGTAGAAGGAPQDAASTPSRTS